MSWISNFYEDEQFYAPAASYFQFIGPTKEKEKNGDTRPERSTEY